MPAPLPSAFIQPRLPSPSAVLRLPRCPTTALYLVHHRDMMFLDARWQDRGYLLLQVLPSAAVVGRPDAHMDLVVYFSDLEVDDEPRRHHDGQRPDDRIHIDHVALTDVIALPIQLPT